MTAEWNAHVKQYTRMGSPMRPVELDVEKIGTLINGHDGKVLMLGVTPAYINVGKDLTAVDCTEQMISEHWRTDNPARRAIKGAWENLPFQAGQFTAIIGDGSYNSLTTQASAVFDELGRVLIADGIVAIRTFCTPDEPETLNDIVRSYEKTPDANSTALRFRIAMSLAPKTRDYIVSLSKVLTAFNEIFPDRDKLEAITGWNRYDIDRFDLLENSDLRISFPTRDYVLQQARQSFDHVKFVESEGYPLAERCPLLVLR